MAWSTVAQADTYLAAGLSGGQWSDLSSAEKEQYLTESRRTIENDPSYCMPDTIPERVREAQIEFAAHLLENPETLEAVNLARQGVASFSVSRFSMSFRGPGETPDGRSLYPPIVGNLLSKYRCRPPMAARMDRDAR